MLVNPPPHLSHSSSSMHVNVCMHETNREGRKNHLNVVVPMVVWLVHEMWHNSKIEDLEEPTSDLSIMTQ